MIKIISVVGARPNFMKVAPLHRAFEKNKFISSKIVHTGQHYDERMSDIFFNQLGLPKPHYYLGIGGGTHTYQKAHVMLAFEQVLNKENPDLVLVVGDVNATMATSVVAVGMGIPVAHVEAGLRSWDRSMPEEINRIITDSISDLLFVTEQSGIENLAKENIPEHKVHFVGNVMIDSLVHFRKKAKEGQLLNELNLIPKEFILMTMHRPSNVDNLENLKKVIAIIKNAAAQKTVVFPMHPRTKNNIEKFNLINELNAIENLIVLEPQGYLQFLQLMDNACLLITDSGGIQEETTFLGVPCLTFRKSTERPVTVELGTNQLLANLDVENTKNKMMDIINGNSKKGIVPPLWDGKTAERIADIFVEKYFGK